MSQPRSLIQIGLVNSEGTPTHRNPTLPLPFPHPDISKSVYVFQLIISCPGVCTGGGVEGRVPPCEPSWG